MADSEKNWMAIVIGFGIAVAFIVSVGARFIWKKIDARLEQRRSLQRNAELRRNTAHEVEQIVITTASTTKFNIDDFSSEEDAHSLSVTGLPTYNHHLVTCTRKAISTALLLIFRRFCLHQ